MAKACRFCQRPIPGIRGKRAVFCSSICGTNNELSRQPSAIARRQREAIHRAEQQTNESLKAYIDQRAAVLRIQLEEKVGERTVSENEPRQVLLVRPELEKE
jgi:hypothetical protein